MKSVHENLEILGIQKSIASVIEALSDGEPHSLHEIERIADMRQSEVSIAVSAISPFVTTTIRTGVNPGRPQKVVQMNHENYLRYVNEFAEHQKRKFENAMRVLDEENKRMRERGE